jgi:hypothetical protein
VRPITADASRRLNGPSDGHPREVQSQELTSALPVLLTFVAHHTLPDSGFAWHRGTTICRGFISQ